MIPGIRHRALEAYYYYYYYYYTADVARIVEALDLGAHLYADDTQLYGHCPPANSFELASRVLRAIDSIHEWMSSNRLSLNTGNSFGLARSTVLPREIQIGSSVYFRPLSNLHP